MLVIGDYIQHIASYHLHQYSRNSKLSEMASQSIKIVDIKIRLWMSFQCILQFACINNIVQLFPLYCSCLRLKLIVFHRKRFNIVFIHRYQQMFIWIMNGRQVKIILSSLNLVTFSSLTIILCITNAPLTIQKVFTLSYNQIPPTEINTPKPS